MTTDERIDQLEIKVKRLAVVQDEMMDVLGLSLEGERRLATRTERLEEAREQDDARHAKLENLVHEIGDKLNALIAIVDGMIQGPKH